MTVPSEESVDRERVLIVSASALMIFLFSLLGNQQ
jgi:hypothetical protein